MKIAFVLAFAGLLALSASARAERFDCSLFRGAQAQFACYDNVSRAPRAEPKEALKPEQVKPNAAAARHRKPRAN
jgi:hypothetical protein